MSDQTKKEILAAFRQKGFLVAFVVFLTAAVGLNAAINFGGLEFRKQRVELKRDLNAIPETLGPWVMAMDVRLPEEFEHSLGTKVYIDRSYIDSRLVSRAKIDALRKLTDQNQQQQELQRLTRADPRSVIRVHIPFYTGMADTVAHVPERCFVANGQDPENPETIRLPVFKDTPGRKPDLEMRYVEFRDRDRTTSSISNVAYVFQVNGAYESDSLGGVRARMQDIFQKYVYYAKVELNLHLPDNPKQAQSVMADFLSYAMPEIEKSMPDWKAVTGQEPELNNHY